MSDKGAVFPMFYLPPIEYIAQLNRYKQHVLLEREEHFPKQTYRNRASIYSPDGILDLVVPVIKGSKLHTKVKDVKISYDFRWQRLHWMSLQSCYRRSAYFEFYEDDFAPFYERRFEFLFDFNEQLFNLILKAIKLKPQISYTAEFQQRHLELPDFRHTIHPKTESEFEQKPYFQVFEERKGFLKNLSIVDLLFNQGPQAINYL
jgi:hypothetical protein